MDASRGGATSMLEPDSTTAADRNNYEAAPDAEPAPSLPKSITDIPPVLLPDIAKYLTPIQLIKLIQASQTIRSGLPQWNMVEFTAQQLVYLYGFIAKPPTKIRTEPVRVDDEAVTKIKEQMLSHLPGALKKYLEHKDASLEHNIFNCYYHNIKALLSNGPHPSPECIIAFLDDFHYKNKTVKEFCRTIAELDFHGASYRCSKLTPNEDTLISHLLFWLATEYVYEQQGDLDRDIIGFRWNRFYNNVDKQFGESSITSKVFRDCITGNGILLIKYREFIDQCDEQSPLRQIYDTLKTLYSRDRNANLDFGDYATYMLSRGLDHTLGFLREQPEELKFLRERDKREIQVWKNMWNNFEEPVYIYS